MSGLFASGGIIDIILVLTAIEAAGVVLCRRTTGYGPPVGEFLCTLLAGVCLMVALRLALVSAWWGWIAACMLAALGAHLAYLRGRWNADRRGPPNCKHD
jgi:hypothetical protein